MLTLRTNWPPICFCHGFKVRLSWLKPEVVWLCAEFPVLNCGLSKRKIARHNVVFQEKLPFVQAQTTLYQSFPALKNKWLKLKCSRIHLILLQWNSNQSKAHMDAWRSIYNYTSSESPSTVTPFTSPHPWRGCYKGSRCPFLFKCYWHIHQCLFVNQARWHCPDSES